jgi:thioredoxin reductase (NADPH)
MPAVEPPGPDKPAILAVDEDETGNGLLNRELIGRYGGDYWVLVERSVNAALGRLRELGRAGVPVALVLAPRQPAGPELLAAAHAIHPHAKRALLLRWGEFRAAREEIVHTLTLGQADYFVVTPAASPDERFHRAITEFLDEWWSLRGTPFEAVRVLGDERSARTHEICDLLQRHDFPYGFYRSDSPAGRAILAEAGIVASDRPVVVLADGRAFVDPSLVEVAEALGARTRPGPGVYDVVVVGGGPAGLAVAVSAASEGLRTALVERVALGGQAGTSSLIRNYLGFPRGISGAELAARAVDQAILFGTELIYGSAAVSLTTEGDRHVIAVEDGHQVTGRTVVIATGVSYRRLNVRALEPFTGVGVFYGAATAEARSLSHERVYVVGGGNSAGQAAMHLAKFADHVTILVRSDSLAHSMSEYLIKDLSAAPNVELRYGVEVVDGGGQGRLQWLSLRDCHSEETETTPAAALFVLIGAEPFTDWLPASIDRDEWGYLLTGSHYENSSSGTGWRSDAAATRPVQGTQRGPLPFQTSVPGVFAVGDVRRGSVKRVASAAGEGAMSVRLIHEYLSPVVT